jgi:hypothetical protein
MAMGNLHSFLDWYDATPSTLGGIHVSTSSKLINNIGQVLHSLIEVVGVYFEIDVIVIPLIRQVVWQTQNSPSNK